MFRMIPSAALVAALMAAPVAMAGQVPQNEKFPPEKMAEIRTLLIAQK
ncbi:MAG: hypothetical protein AAF919_02540 [Pseudomonadota bacterium]